MRPVEVRCATNHEWKLDPYAAHGVLAYVEFPDWVHPRDYTVMHPWLCWQLVRWLGDDRGADFKNVSLAILVVVHESYHLRGDLPHALDEAVTQCRAIRHVRYAARFFGFDEELARQVVENALWWDALIRRNVPEYHLPGCKRPTP